MNENMAHFQKKIEEMQRKLNMINDNIEDIKSGRINFEEKKRNNKNDDFMKNNIKKKHHLKMINNSINFFNKKTEINSDHNSIVNTRNLHCKYKNSFSNNNLLNNMPKNTRIINNKLNINNEINEQKYSNYPYENSKNETPTFIRNNSNCQIIHISKEYQLNKNKDLKKKMRKINSASEIINSLSIIRGHKKLKKYLKEKTNKNKLNINNIENNNNIEYNFSYNTEKVPSNKTKTHYSKSIENSRMNHALNKGYLSCQNMNINNKNKKNSNTIDKNSLNYNYNSLTSNRSYCHRILNKENKNEKILENIINLTNEYNACLNNNKCIINKENIFNAYKLLLINNKIKDEFIFKLMNMYNKYNKLKIDMNNLESLTPILNWIKINNEVKQENDEYKILCLEIMKKYNLKNIEQLKIFIQKLFKRVNNNEYFLEGIKKILLP